MESQTHLELIDQYLQEQQWVKAEALCEALLDNQPDDVEGYLRLGKAMVGLGKTNQAIQAYAHCLKLQHSPIKIYAELGYLYHQTQDFSKALVHYQKALSLRPSWIGVSFNLAVVYQHLGHWPNAIKQYQQVLSQQNDHVKALFNLAILYEKQGKLEKSEQTYRLLAQLHPRNFNIFSNFGNLLFQQNRYEESIVLFETALQLNPHSAKILNNIGQAYLAQGHLQDAIPYYQKAIAHDPTLATSQRALGRIFLQNHQYSQAQTYFKHLCERSPQDIEAHNDLGLIYSALGEWPKALLSFRHIIVQQFDFVELFCQRLGAGSPNPQDWYEKAQFKCRDFLQSLHQNEESNVCLTHLSLSYQYLGQALLDYGATVQAEGYFQKSLQLYPDCLETYLLLGQCFVQQKRLDAAVTILNIGLLMYPKEPELMFRLGTVLEQQGRAKDAIDYYEQLLQPSSQSNFPLHAQKQQIKPPQGDYDSTQDWFYDALNRSDLPHPKWIEVAWGNELPPHSPVEPPSHTSTQTQTSCGGVTCTACMSTLISLFEPVQLGKNVFQCSLTEKASVAAPQTFVVEIPDGQAWIAPQKNAWLICKEMAILTADRYLLGDLSRFYPWYLPGCSKHDVTQHSVFEGQEVPPLKEINGTVAILSGLSGHVFYHWMIDILPRLGLLQASTIDLEKIDWFVVNSLAKPFQRETLQTLGISLEKIIESDRVPYLQAKQLIVPSFPGHLDWVPKGTIDFLRATFLRPTNAPGLRRIYISRAQARYRQVVNEPAIINILEQFGFVSLDLETFSVAEQAELFASAEVIVAAHGAALTNLVFCTEGAKIIEFFSPNYIRTDYWMVSQQLRLEHYYITGRSFQGHFIRKLMHQNSLTEDIWIDPESVYLAMDLVDLQRS